MGKEMIPPARAKRFLKITAGPRPTDGAPLDRSLSLLGGLGSLDGLDQHGGDLEQVAADAVVGDLEDGSGVVLVHGDDALGVLHTGLVLDGGRGRSWRGAGPAPAPSLAGGVRNDPADVEQFLIFIKFRQKFYEILEIVGEVPLPVSDERQCLNDRRILIKQRENIDRPL